MPIYSYHAMNTVGRTLKGKLNAQNELDLEQKLQELGLTLVTAKDLGETSLGGGSQHVTIADLIVLCLQMEQLERAGVPLLDALEDLQNTADSLSIKNLMAEIHNAVKQGKMLSEAMAEHPRIFDEVFVGLVAAGERTGNMYTIFSHLANHLKWVRDLQKKIKGATYYPMFLGLMMIGVVSLMMLYVIPQLTTFLLSQNISLPIYTVALINTSNFVVHYWPMILFCPTALFFAIRYLRTYNENFSIWWDNVLLLTPIFGDIIRKLEIARVCRFFALTYSSGIGILDCLEIASKVIRNRIIKESVLEARQSVLEGRSLSEALRASSQFPGLVLRMVKVGEESGNLESALENINFFYDREVNDSVSRLLGMIQPTLTIIMGLIMLWISISVFGPLYHNLGRIAG